MSRDNNELKSEVDKILERSFEDMAKRITSLIVKRERALLKGVATSTKKDPKKRTKRSREPRETESRSRTDSESR